MPSSPFDARTEKHGGPTQVQSQRGRSALVVAHPPSAAFGFDGPKLEVGRALLGQFGSAFVDEQVSGRHLEIERTRNGVLVRDVGSTNGTWVDGQPLVGGPCEVADGSVIRLGNTILVYREEIWLAEPGGDPLRPSRPLSGLLVAPYGLRLVERKLAGLAALPPKAVLVRGETGSGKELVAGCVAHRLRPGKTFVAVNVAAITPSLFEAQLFGHVRGAFTGAVGESVGYVGHAAGGALFLDEIGELPLELQPRLLRLVENGEVQRVGAARVEKVDVVIVAATNRDLLEMSKPGPGGASLFRQDLYQRLAQEEINVPSLDDRIEDIPAIIQGLWQRLAPGAPLPVEVEAMERLMLEPWPGNVRQLDAVLGRVVRQGGPPMLSLWAVEAVLGPRASTPLLVTAEGLREAIARENGNQSAAAKRLGITRGKLRRLLASEKKGQPAQGADRGQGAASGRSDRDQPVGRSK